MLAGGEGGGLGFVEDGGEVLAGEGVGDGGYFLGGAYGDDVSTLIAGLRPEIYEVICGLDEVQVVLDEDDGVAVIDQSSEGPSAGRRRLRRRGRLLARPRCRRCGPLPALKARWRA